MSTTRLALDLSGTSVRVLEGMPGGPMRCAEAPMPEGAMATELKSLRTEAARLAEENARLRQQIAERFHQQCLLCTGTAARRIRQ